MKEYLACYDYGTGGIWYWMLAASAQEVRLAFPQFIVFESKPDWWKNNPMKDLPVHRIGEPLDSVLAKICLSA
jgi:hypothetical protein